MADDSADPDLRRRAAWLLALIAVVAVLVVVIMIKLGDGSDRSTARTGTAPLDTLSATGTSHPPRSSSTSRPAPRPRTSATRSGSGPTGPSTADCPTNAPCVLQGDAAKAIAAVNAYRTSNGRDAVPGTVSKAAQSCALSDGGDCSGGWAETYLNRLDGTAAVAKIAKLGKLLDPELRSFEVGWAYRPRSGTYYLAVIRSD